MTAAASILVLNYNGRHLLAEYLPSVVAAAEHSDGRHRVVVVDNASTDGSARFVREQFPSVQFWPMDQNRLLFSYNDAVAKCETDYVVLLNNDVAVGRGFIEPLMLHFADPLVFAVTPRVLSGKADEEFTTRCPGLFEFGVMSTGRTEGLEGPGNTLLAHGGVAAYDRDKFLSLGGFDDLFWPGYGEDSDLSYRAWMKGWTIRFEPGSEAFHYGSATTDAVHSVAHKRRIQERARALFIMKNIGDPEMMRDFLFWSAVRVAKATATLDYARLGAYWDSLLALGKAMDRRRQVQRNRLLSDKQILRKARHGADGE